MGILAANPDTEQAQGSDAAESGLDKLASRIVHRRMVRPPAPAVGDRLNLWRAHLGAGEALDAFHFVGFPDIVFRDSIHLAFDGALATVSTGIVNQPFIAAKLGQKAQECPCGTDIPTPEAAGQLLQAKDGPEKERDPENLRQVGLGFGHHQGPKPVINCHCRRLQEGNTPSPDQGGFYQERSQGIDHYGEGAVENGKGVKQAPQVN